MKTSIHMCSVLAIGCLLAACGKDNAPTSPNLNNQTTSTSIVATQLSAAVMQTLPVEIESPLEQEFMQIDKEFKSELNCIQMTATLPLAKENVALFNFASDACPASGAIESRNVVFQLRSDVMALPQDGDKAASESQEERKQEQKNEKVQRGFLIFKGSRALPVQQSQTPGKQQDGAAKEQTQLIEEKIGEFEVISWTEQVSVENRQQQQGERQEEIGMKAKVEEKTIEHTKVILTKLCTDEYATTCHVVLAQGHFSGIELLAKEAVASEQGKKAAPQIREEKENVIPQVKEALPKA